MRKWLKLLLLDMLLIVLVGWEYKAGAEGLALTYDLETMQHITEEEDMNQSTGKQIALTFDDGPNPTYTTKLLDGLRERGVHATFFLLGQNVEQYPEIVRTMHEDGHLIGNHTYSHMQLTSGNGEQFAEELKKTDEAIFAITGEHTEYVRPPYGIWDKKYEQELDMLPVLWNIDPKDWCTSDAGTVITRVTGHAEENAIILLHDCYGSSVEAALQIIDILQAQGYEFVTVDELIME